MLKKLPVWFGAGLLKGWTWMWDKPQRVLILLVTCITLARWLAGDIETDDLVKVFSLGLFSFN